MSQISYLCFSFLFCEKACRLKVLRTCVMINGLFLNGLLIVDASILLYFARMSATETFVFFIELYLPCLTFQIKRFMTGRLQFKTKIILFAFMREKVNFRALAHRPLNITTCLLSCLKILLRNNFTTDYWKDVSL